MHQKQLWKRVLTLLTAMGCAATIAATASADIGTEKWQKILNVNAPAWDLTAFRGVSFRGDGSVLASGDGGGGFAVRYNAETGALLDNPPEWIDYESGTSNANYFYGQVIDSNGDIYFAGRHDSFDPGVWKYDSSAALQSGWPKVHAVTGDGLNTGVALDASGFVYSVGYNNSDWHISKYDTSDGSAAAGFPLSYDHNGFLDKASKIAIDSEDNFIISGWVGLADGTYDWHVRKYASDGTLLWSTSYDLKGNTEAAIDIGIDSEDNIIVCGYRNNGTDETTGMDRDWYIVKYAKVGDGAGGATVLWEQSWNGGNGSASRVARTLLIDSSDNVYVAGDQNDSSDTARSFIQYRDGETGTLLKSQELSHPVTVRGGAGTAGTEHDYIGDLALNGDQLVVAGYVWEGYFLNGRTAFITMLELLPSVGTEEWSSTYYTANSPYSAHFYGVDFLNNDTLLTAGFQANGSNWEGMGIRLNTTTGMPIDTPPEWINAAPSTIDTRFMSQSIGGSGNIYFAGLEYGGNSGTVWKYASDGTAAAGWPKHFTNVSWAYDAVEDKAGNVYGVGAYSGGSWDAVDRDWAIYKYTSAGVLITGFPKYYDHAGQYDTAYRVAVDSSDNFIVAGVVTQTPTAAPTHQDWLVRKFNSSGTLLWEKFVDLKGLNDFPYHILVDTDDNIIVSGRRNNGSDDSTGTNHDIYIVKYAKDDGSIIWEQTWDSGRSDIPERMVFDSRENIFVAVRVENADGNYRPTIQYRSGRTGELLKSQKLAHVTTQQNNPTTETHSGLYLALNNGQLGIASVIDDTSNPATHDRTAYTILLEVEQTLNVITGSADSDCSDGECNLQAALDEAENNGGLNTVLHLQQGTYTGNFTYEPASGNNGDLTILGGYSADFSTRTLDPTNTILDGGNTGAVLQLNPGVYAGTTTVNGSLIVEGLT